MLSVPFGRTDGPASVSLTRAAVRARGYAVLSMTPAHKPTAYHFHRCLGRGGFGEVYLATQRLSSGLEREVAVKLLSVELSGDTRAVRRFRDEGRILARLSHPNILTVYDLVQLDGRTALVTEYVAGRDLADGFGAAVAMSHRALVEVIGQVASALLAAWGASGPDGPLRLVHRDVKPSNIRVGHHGQVRLLDFGIAYFLDPARESETTSHVIMGSLPYMSPERFLDDRRASAADVFGLGCCLFEGLTGERFHERSDFGTLSALALNSDHFDAHWETQCQRLEHVDTTLVELVSEMLSREPDRRPSLEDLVSRLERWQEGARGERLRAWCRAHEVSEDEGLFGSWVGNTLEEGEPLVNETLPPLLESARIALTQIATGETSRLLAPDGAVVRWWTRAWRWLVRRRWPVLLSGAGCFVVLGLALGLVGLLVIGGFSVARIVS